VVDAEHVLIVKADYLHVDFEVQKRRTFPQSDNSSAGVKSRFISGAAERVQFKRRVFGVFFFKT
jgi:hypothetical protein